MTSFACAADDKDDNSSRNYGNLETSTVPISFTPAGMFLSYTRKIYLVLPGTRYVENLKNNQVFLFFFRKIAKWGGGGGGGGNRDSRLRGGHTGVSVYACKCLPMIVQNGNAQGGATKCSRGRGGMLLPPLKPPG